MLKYSVLTRVGVGRVTIKSELGEDMKDMVILTVRVLGTQVPMGQFAVMAAIGCAAC